MNNSVKQKESQIIRASGGSRIQGNKKIGYLRGNRLGNFFIDFKYNQMFLIKMQLTEFHLFAFLL